MSTSSPGTAEGAEVREGAIAIIGFGEVGGILARDLGAAGVAGIAAYDIAFADPASRQSRAARERGVAACGSAAEAAAGAGLVISAVTASAALDAALVDGALDTVEHRERVGAAMTAVTLRELANEARVSPGYISELERGRKEVSSELLASVCVALDTTVSELLLEAAANLSLQAMEQKYRLGSSLSLPK